MKYSYQLKNFWSWLKSNLIILILLSLMAGICSLIAINGHTPFYVTYDGIIHVSRFEQAFQSLRAGKVPSEVSFIIPGHKLNALMSCYPWLSSILFFFPRFIINNIVISFLIGYVCINFLTIISMYLLSYNLTQNKVIAITSGCIYLFNSYHLVVLYAAMELGEALAYAFLPFAVLGYIYIMNNEGKKGIFFLSLGMSGIANSHFMTLVLATLAIIIISIALLAIQKLRGEQIKQIVISGLISILMSLYSIYSYLNIKLNNSIVMPFKSLVNVNLWLSLKAAIHLIVPMSADGSTVGLILILIYIFLVMGMLKSGKRLYIIFIILSISIIILISFPFNIFGNNSIFMKCFGVIQFQRRLLPIFIFLVIIMFNLYFRNIYINDEYLNKDTIKRWKLNSSCFIMCIFLIIVSIIGVYKVENNKNIALYNRRSGIDFILNNKDYNRNVYNPLLNGFGDYLPGRGSQSDDPKIGETYKLGDNNTNLLWQSTNYNSETFKLYAKRSQKSSLDLAFYKNVNYRIFINDREVHNLSKNKFLVYVKKGESILTIESNPTKLTKFIFYLTIIVNITFYCWGVIFFFYIKSCKQKR